jgi:uncharacterized protein YmfQ (DUF2313 family)
MRTALEYLRMFQSLLPKGKAWNRAADSVLTQFLYGSSDEFSRLDERSEDLQSERDTRTTSELLTEHETDLGLPDDCSDAAATITERRIDAHARLLALGQQDKQYFIDLAESLGYEITITEYTPFWCGLGVAGNPCGDQEVIFVWTVNTTYGAETIYFTAGSSQAGDPLVKIPTLGPLECIIEKYKPGHTTVNFNYTGPGFSQGFNIGFDSLPSEEESYLEGGFSRGFSSGYNVFYGGGFDKNAFTTGFHRPA